MRLLVTGALGHIGSRLIHDIKPGEFDEVVLVDDFSVQRYCSLFNLPDGVPFRFVEADVCKADLAPLVAGMDVVIHLAAITNAAGSFDNQAQVERVNLEGTRRVAEVCAAAGARFVFLSTTSVYGTQAEVVDESCAIDELKPQSPYADSKLKAERMLTALGTSAGLRFITCRFGTIFGTSVGMRFHTAVNKFCWQAVVGQPITVWRTALHQRRPYLELGDAVRALRFIIETDRFDGEIYNVLTLNATVHDIVETIREFVPDLRIELVDTRIMNQLSYTVSSRKFDGLGFQYGGNLREGVGATVGLLRGLRATASVPGH
jgi:nucleoside-diphosphate-sugar epimerase